MTPRVDVVMPVLDGERHIHAAVQSVLTQSGIDCRAVVVDAGSTDGTVDLVRSWQDPRVTLEHATGHLLAGAARNLGVRRAAGPWLAFLDSDDLWAAGAAAALVAAVRDPSSEMAVGHAVTFRDGRSPRGSRPASDASASPMVGTVLMARGLFDRVGDFDPQLRVGEFVDWMARARSLGVREAPVASTVLLRRGHAANTSRTRRGDYAADVLRIAQRHRARQRGHG